MTKIEELKAAFEAASKTITLEEWEVNVYPDSGDPVAHENAIVMFTIRANNLMPQLLEAVELLETAVIRVRMANDEGHNILSGWRKDAEALLEKLK